MIKFHRDQSMSKRSTRRVAPVTSVEGIEDHAIKVRAGVRAHQDAVGACLANGKLHTLTVIGVQDMVAKRLNVDRDAFRSRTSAVVQAVDEYLGCMEVGPQHEKRVLEVVGDSRDRRKRASSADDGPKPKRRKATKANGKRYHIGALLLDFVYTHNSDLPRSEPPTAEACIDTILNYCAEKNLNSDSRQYYYVDDNLRALFPQKKKISVRKLNSHQQKYATKLRTDLERYKHLLELCL
ncbi:MAG: hypothetical protein KVP17_002224 [Porospora cf. gigantea B]|uniref:uncharacterized protein n=1 Tax=Porospora cf. gigantea B TaxID=2853592 RepID=UPI003571C145|nr:MAG: hypothetical protein KVP17_002224 [Porospora cf. gigantea B]